MFIYVDGGLDNKGFLMFGIKFFGDDVRIVGVFELFCVIDGFIVFFIGVFVVVINEWRINMEMRS